MKKTALLSLAAVLASAGLVSGCATDELKKEIADVRTLAEQAQGTANAADAKAQQALDAANNAQACCNENSEKIDRMFRKAMLK